MTSEPPDPAPEPAEPPRPPLIDARGAVVLAVAAAVLLGVFLMTRIGQQWGSGSTDAARSLAAGEMSASAGASAFIPQDAPASTAAIEHRAARARADAKLQEFVTSAATIRGTVGRALDALDAFEADCRALMHDERGRAVAAHEDLALEALALTDRYYRDLLAGTRAGHQSILDQLDTLQAPVDEALGNPSSIWAPDNAFEDLDRLRESAESALQVYRDAGRALNRVVHEASTRGGPVDEPLEQVLSRLDGAQSAEHAERIRAIREGGLAELYKNAEAKEQERVRLAAIASSPKALELLYFTGVGTKGPDTWRLPTLAYAFESEAVFWAWARHEVAEARYGADWDNLHKVSQGRTEANKQEINDHLTRLSNEARDKLGLNLWELFRVFVLSESNRDLFLSEDEIRAFLEQALQQDAEATADSYQSTLRRARPLPEPHYP